ncbi:hypothetical protein BDV33DRAFT_197228 [Aspergillus novoparasiticus]|uniref:Uncharacterized protein n=1 Tax=Aspergillus novoparasiticus TaxID=986946 RepID=A0A5N6E6C3_9EURO|nr:hypothetical protein BDV33DRAFT_197228 [Aspergillus novoparasiticus]
MPIILVRLFRFAFAFLLILLTAVSVRLKPIQPFIHPQPDGMGERLGGWIFARGRYSSNPSGSAFSNSTNAITIIINNEAGLKTTLLSSDNAAGWKMILTSELLDLLSRHDDTMIQADQGKLKVEQGQ